MKNKFSEIRRTFLNYFVKNGHTEVKSSNLVPKSDDKSLLFTNSGMVQFKDYFTGKEEPKFKKATTAQKSLRAGGKHNDLENVGYTGRHHTFFEMLGNFSFGDYFKEEAIYHAWNVITKEFNLPKEKLYITIFHEDEDALSLWKKISGFSENKIIRINTIDNFWSMGDSGPCGPCSEIFYDYGENVPGGLPGTKDADLDRYVEIWNLVFMQFEQMTSGERKSLPKPSIDTGMGLERIASILEGKQSNFDTEIFCELKNEINFLVNSSSGINFKVNNFHDEKFFSKTSGTKCNAQINDLIQKDKIKIYNQSLNVVADHIRAASFLISEGVFPSNEGRGYVLRRIIRRATRHLNFLGCKEPVLYKLHDKLSELMGEHYSELITESLVIKRTLLSEEEKFIETIDGGVKILEEEISKLENNSKIFSGDIAFKLYDTYGFPLDLTEDILKGKGIIVEKEKFNELMEQQRTQSQKNNKFKNFSDESINELIDKISDFESTNELCYDSNFSKSSIIYSSKNNDGTYSIILDKTPFYAESGGQISDNGIIFTDQNDLSSEKYFIDYFNDLSSEKISEKISEKFNHENLVNESINEITNLKNKTLNVIKVKKIKNKSKCWILHVCEFFENSNENSNENDYLFKKFFSNGKIVFAKIDFEKRKKISSNHSGTHLLQAALRKVLGSNVMQRGSLVSDSFLRFDFTHNQKLSFEEIKKIEEIVNEEILKSSKTLTEVLSYEKAIEGGALAFFDEKYSSNVRVVKIGVRNENEKIKNNSNKNDFEKNQVENKSQFQNESNETFSKELCGGTHVKNTGEIGIFKIITESGIAAGVRRIEAKTGNSLIENFENEISKLKNENEKLKNEIKKQEKEKENFLIKFAAENVTKNDLKINSYHISILETKSEEKLTREIYSRLAKFLNDDTKKLGILFINKNENSASVILEINQKHENIDASEIIKETLKIINGNGGGKKNFAQCLIKNVKDTNNFVDSIKINLEKKLKKI